MKRHARDYGWGLAAVLLLLGACATARQAPMDVYFNAPDIPRKYTVVGSSVGIAPEGMENEYLQAGMAKKARKAGADAILVLKTEKISPARAIPWEATTDRAERALGVVPGDTVREVRIECVFIKYDVL